MNFVGRFGPVRVEVRTPPFANKLQTIHERRPPFSNRLVSMGTAVLRSLNTNGVRRFCMACILFHDDAVLSLGMKLPNGFRCNFCVNSKRRVVGSSGKSPRSRVLRLVRPDFPTSSPSPFLNKTLSGGSLAACSTSSVGLETVL